MDERDRLRALLRSSLPPDDDDEEACPSAEQLYLAAHALLPLREREQIVDHLTRCASCDESWQATRRTLPPAAGRQVFPGTKR